jgi:hypothetical protein
MTVQLSTNARNGLLDAIETELITGGAPVLKIRSGAPPANCAAADSGTVGATMSLPADPFGAAAAGVKSKSGTWEDASADASITAGHFRLYKNDGTTCVFQGTVTGIGGGGDMEIQNVSINAGQAVTVTQFDITAPNA